MDTSETYIKMCDCPEIQKAKPDGSQGEFVYCEGTAYQEMDDRPLTPFIWLPRQDQLQEMVEYTSPLHLLEYLNNFVMTTENGLVPAIFNSMEQLWLAFVMKEKFNKVWDGNKWVKET